MEIIIKKLLENNLIKKEDEKKVEKVLRETVYSQVLKNDILHVIEIEDIQGIKEDIVMEVLDAAQNNIDYSNYNNQILELISKAIKEK